MEAYDEEWDYGDEGDNAMKYDDKPSNAEASMLAATSNCPKSADGKFMFVTYEDVLK